MKFWEDPSNIFSIITAIAALLGIFLPFIKTGYDERKKYKSIFEFVVQLAEVMEPLIDKRIKDLNNIINSISEDSQPIWFGITTSSLTDSFFSINKDDLFKTFMVWLKCDKDKKKYYGKLVDSFYSIDNTLKIDFSNFNNYIKFRSQYKRQLFRGVNSILRTYDKYLYIKRSGWMGSASDPFLEAISSVISTWDVSINKNSKIKIKSELLEPIKEISTKCIDYRAIEMLKYISICNNALLNLEMLDKSYIESFNKAIEELGKVRKNIKETTVYFKTYYNKKITQRIRNKIRCIL